MTMVEVNGHLSVVTTITIAKEADKVPTAENDGGP